jgi:hypothetical protein
MQNRNSIVPRSKLELLPIPRADAERVSLEYHLALDTSRRGFGSARTVRALTDALVISHYLREQGVGRDQEAAGIFVAAQDAVNGCDCAAARRGILRLPDASVAAIGRLLCFHDRQLRVAPRHAVIKAVACRDAYWVTRTKSVDRAPNIKEAA